MNKTILSPPEVPRISVDYAGYLHLGPFWNRMNLSGPFWRLYHHDSKGAGILLENERVEMLPGYCYILPPHCSRQTFCSGSPRQLYIHFELSMGSGNAASPVHIVPMSDELHTLASELKEALRQDEGDCLRPSLLALALCARALSHLPPETLMQSSNDRRMELACDYLREHLSSPVNLDTLAARVKMTPNAFSRLFREKTGVTPYQYLLQLRYNQASKLLHSDQYSIDEISEMVGIKDRFHFSRTFKRIYGVPPAQYRRNYAPGKS
ncbi:MAG: helix-turn-helix domain-containing protein [Lentisphaeria bacterium]|nr:helix-turn-helix domain-containing protein [Lentisphaeria bacterium]